MPGTLHEGRKTQHGSANCENGKWQISDRVLDIAKKRIPQKIHGKGVGNVIEPNCAQEPPALRPKRLLQAPDREQRKKVGPQSGDSKEDKHPARWGGSDVAQPAD
jgi:hypothetical protein